MLKTVYLTQQFDKADQDRACVMLLGGFDGLHAGHKKLVETARGFRLPVGIMTIVGGKDTQSVFTLHEREEIFKRAGLDFVFELPFAEIKDLSARAFIALLIQEFQPIAFVCGDDFRFGKDACGTPQTLKEMGQVRVGVEELLMLGGEKIGSSAVKTCLLEGKIERANALLGEEFFLLGEVVQDRGVGRTLGFPTANTLYPREKFPVKRGVYETRVEVAGEEYKAITNYGNRPTFDEAKIVLETHLDGFSGELYGKEIKIRFKRYLRDIQKFENAGELRAQLQEDIRRVREND